MSAPSSVVRVARYIVVFGIILLAGAVSANRLEAAVSRNQGFQELTHEILTSADDCSQLRYEASMPLLEDTVMRQPDDVSVWIALLRMKAVTDRAWIADRLTMATAVEHRAIDAAKAEIMPKYWATSGQWNYARCQSAWDVWTVGLMDATSHDWQQAVAAYQAGIGLALGRVPETIIKEYYAALANEQLAQSKTEPDQRLQAAKYLALGGDALRASDLFRSLTTEFQLTPEQRCEAEAGLTWLQAGDAKAVPPWPITSVRNGQCVDTSESSQTSEWQLAPDQVLTDANHGATLIGFDLDRDVLEAGAEVIGILYWQLPDGAIQPQRFRQPNLWPNSGNSWQPFGETWACLPGYMEPSWLAACAGRIEPGSMNSPTKSPLGYLTTSPGQEQGTFITSASVQVPASAFIVYGGWWFVQQPNSGSYVARNQLGVDNQFEIVLDLAAQPPNTWQARAALVSPAVNSVEVEQWVRPSMVQHDQTLVFDDVFSFAIPPMEHGH
jgi:hypothetical protein